MKQISIEIIHKCPNKCLHCSSCSDVTCTMKLDTDKILNIIDSAKILETEIISISGGEPFLHEGLLDIVKYIKSQGIKVYLYTSGVVITSANEIDSIEDKTFKILKNMEVDKIIFDLPAIDEKIYDEFMGTLKIQNIFVHNSVTISLIFILKIALIFSNNTKYFLHNMIQPFFFYWFYQKIKWLVLKQF